MKKGVAVKGILAVFGMIVLILDTQTALRGAKDGITACIATVIPALFPFILLSSLLNDAVTGECDHIPEGIMKAAGLPAGTSPLLISAILGGYPAGAQAVHRAYSNGALRKQDAERVLAYMNNAGPAFIFGMAGHMFPFRAAPWILWGIHIISAFMVRLLIGPTGTPVCDDIRGSKRTGDVILSTARIMCTVCVWVITFRLVMTYLDVWSGMRMPEEIRPVVFGALELVNGCCELPRVVDLRGRFVIFSGLLAFGGSCVMMQTVSVVKKLSIRYYLAGKMLQTVFSIVISAALVFRKWYMMPVFLLPAVIFVLRNKNKGRNPVPLRV